MRPGIGKYCWDKTVSKGMRNLKSRKKLPTRESKSRKKSPRNWQTVSIKCTLKMLRRMKKWNTSIWFWYPILRIQLGKQRFNRKSPHFSLIRKNKLRSKIFLLKKFANFQISQNPLLKRRQFLRFSKKINRPKPLAKTEKFAKTEKPANFKNHEILHLIFENFQMFSTHQIEVCTPYLLSL